MVKRRRIGGPGRSNWRSLVRGGVSAATSVASRFARSYTNTRSKKSSSSSFPLTNQYDARRQYSRKSMPKAKRRRWKSFVKKVRAAAIPQAPRFAVLRSNAAPSAATGFQGYFSGVMYGMGSNGNGNGVDDLYEILQSTTGEGVTPDLQGHYRFKSACLDVEINAAVANTVSLTVDIYEIVCRRNISSSPSLVGATTGNTPDDMFFYGVNDLSLTPSAGAALVASQPAVTPFQSPMFCSSWLIKKKTRVLLSPGQTTHLQLRDPKNRYFTWDRINSNIQSMKGVTKGFLFIYQGVVNAASHSPAVAINYTVDRTYCYDYINPNRPVGQLH